MSSMNHDIHQKLCNIQNKLIDCNIKKSGYNKFQKYNYYDLKDLLPPILRLCEEYGCCIYFIFIDNHAILKFFTNDGEQEINTRIPMPELVPINKGSNMIQSLGAYQTYAKKYLLMNLFGICEVDEIDRGFSENMKDESIKHSVDSSKKESSQPSPKSKSASNSDKPLGWDKVEEFLSNTSTKDVSELTKEDFNKARWNMAKKGLISKKENEAIYNYLKGDLAGIV